MLANVEGGSGRANQEAAAAGQGDSVDGTKVTIEEMAENWTRPRRTSKGELAGRGKYWKWRVSKHRIVLGLPRWGSIRKDRFGRYGSVPLRPRSGNRSWI